MRRTSVWYNRLTAGERRVLYQLERANQEPVPGSCFLPEGYSECSFCSTPCSGGGLCPLCSNELSRLISTADIAIDITGQGWDNEEAVTYYLVRFPDGHEMKLYYPDIFDHYDTEDAYDHAKLIAREYWQGKEKVFTETWLFKDN